MIELIKLEDGRKELRQWDTGRAVTIDGKHTQVHFANVTFGRTKDVEVIDGVAKIPDELLQFDGKLYAYAFSGTYDNGYTDYEHVFDIVKRPKPAGYVFTPTEQQTLEEVKNQIGDLDNLETESKQNLVDAINEVYKNGGVSSADGVGIESVEQTTASTADGGENVITVFLTNGEKYTFSVYNGTKGSPGKEGYTPVRGIDYWTDEDIAQIKSYVDDAILGGKW